MVTAFQIILGPKNDALIPEKAIYYLAKYTIFENTNKLEIDIKMKYKNLLILTIKYLFADK